MTELTRPDTAMPENSGLEDTAGAEISWWPTTALQRGLVAHTLMLQPDTADPYIGQSSIQLAGALEPAEARAATLNLLRRVENLRAGFLLDESGDPVSFVEAFEKKLLDRVFRSGDDAGLLAAQDLAEGFDLADPPLLKVAFASTGGDAHRLIITAHHTVLDGWSMPLLLGQFLREVASLRGTAVPADLPAASGDYAAHLGWIAAAPRETASDFFAQSLEHAQTGPRPQFLVDIPAGGDRRTVHRQLPEATVSALGAVTRANALTPAAALRTAWALAADFVAGTPGNVFAVPVALRDPNRPDAQNVCGMLTETVLTAGDYHPNQNPLQVAVAHQQWWNRSLEHQHLGVPGIERALDAQGELAWSLLSFEPSSRTDFQIPGLNASLTATTDSSHYPVNVHVRAGARWQIELEHDSRLPDQVADTLIEALVQALTALADGEQAASVAALELMDARRVLDFENSGQHYDGQQPLLPELFARQAAATPQATALVIGGTRYSYTELDQLAQHTATELSALLARSTGKPIVAVRLPRTVEMVVAHLAALRSGITLMVLDNAWPDARVQRALQLAGPALIWDAQGLRAIQADTGTENSPAPAAAAPQAASTAGIVFTSGSTGEPKGVAVPHRALAQLFARQQRELYPAGRTLQVAHTSAFHFDAHWDAFLALFAGHTLHVLREDEYLDPFALADYVAAERIGYLDFTPTLWNAVISSGALSTLPEICVAGGEGFPADLWTRMGQMAAESGSTVYNLYGPTEATVDALAASVADSQTPVVGRPVGATGALVLDSMLRRVAPGTVGELYLSGPQLADGYLSRSALTASRFVAHPFAPGERLYRTGDAASWGENGQLVLLGRTDEQISLHGVRIEPGEIESFLTSRDSVRRAAVRKVTDPRLGERLAAWVVPADPQAVNDPQLAAELAADCAAGLPRAMVPAAVVLLEVLPVTGSGKLDTRALPAPNFGAAAVPVAGSAQVPDSASGAPSAELEAVLQAVTQVLSLPEQPAAGERLMSLGGDSIAAIQLVAALHRAGYSTSVARLLAAGTLEQMAQELQPVSARPADGSDAGSRLESLGAPRLAALAAQAAQVGATAVDVWELTPTQLGMVLHHEREADATYQTTTRWRISGAQVLPQAAAVARALDTLAVRHPQLRGIVFQHDLPAPRLAIMDSARWQLSTVDLRAELDVPGAVRAEEAALRAAPMDLAAGPLAHGRLLRTSETSWELVLVMHHLLVDGWSTGLLTEELESLLRGEQLPQAQSMTGYLHWLASLESESAALEESWAAEFAGFGAPSSLAALTRPAQGIVQATAYLEASSTQRLTSLLREKGYTLADAAQAAWASVLAAVTGTTDVALGATRSGRDAPVPGIESMVGMLITTAPVRLRPRAGADAVQLLAQARRQNTELARAAHLGMGRIKSVLGAEPFDTLLVVENYPRREENASGELEVTALGGEDGTNYPVCLSLTPGQELSLEVELAGGDPLTAALLASAVRVALASLAQGIQPHPQQLGVQGLAQQLAAAAATAPGDSARQATAGDRVDSGAAEKTVSGAERERIDLVAQAIAQVLSLTSVDPARDIFALGADSMSVIALIGALRARGLVISLGEIYRNPTAAALAAAATDAVERGFAQPEANGPMQPTAALGWYTGLLERTGANGRGFQQLRVLNVPAGLEPARLRQALATLAERHPALRLKVDRSGAQVQPTGDFQLATVAENTSEDEFTQVLRTACLGLDEQTGKICTAVYRPAATGYGLLALAIHHVAVDIYSWRLLTEDLRLLVAGEQLPPAEPSLRAWSAAVHSAAGTLAADQNLAERWLKVLEPAGNLRYTDAGSLGTLAATTEVVHTLDAATTAGLLALGEGCGMDTVLYAAVAGTLPETAGVVLEAEGHGRPAGTRFADARDTVEVGSTVGWFTATWPLRLSGTAGAQPEAWLLAARSAGASLPADTASYGLLRYLGADSPLAEAEAQAPAQLLVNYLGRDTLAEGPWQPAADAAALESALGLHHELPATHPVELNAYVTDAADGPHLVLRWQLAAANAAGASLPEATREALQQLAAVRPQATGVLHDVVGLGEAELSRLLAERPTAQGIWPLTGVQQAMAVHAASAPSDTYLSLAGLELFGEVDPATLRQAAAALTASHPQLRSTVYWPEGAAPVYVPLASLAPQVAVRSCPGLELAARTELADQARAEHMARAFDLESGPLLRLELIDFGPHPVTGEPHSQLIVANHHLLLDGWSIPPLVDELLEHYARAAAGEPAVREVHPAQGAYDVFARALASRDDTAQVEQWRQSLSGDRPGHVLRHRDTQNTALPTVIGHELGAHLHTALAKRARKASATVADAVNAAWALVLGGLLETDHPVYGTVSSGRAIHVPGMETLPGMFIDTLPVAVDLDQKDPRALLRAAHTAGVRIVESAGVPLARITGALGVGTLFDTLLVVENYPQTDASTPPGAPRLGQIEAQDATEYPLSVSVSVGESLELELEYGAEIPETSARQVLSALVVALECLALGTALPVLRGVVEQRLAPVRESLAQTQARLRTSSAEGAADTAALDAVTRAFAQVLSLPHAEAQTNFFAAGGDSMAAMSLLTALRQAGYKVAISQVFANPVATELAAVAQALEEPAAEPAKPPHAAPAAQPMITLDGASMASLTNLLRGN